MNPILTSVEFETIQHSAQRSVSVRPSEPAEKKRVVAFATTLAHGLSVLQSFRRIEPALTNKDLAVRTGLSKSTISRLTYTLMEKGLLIHDVRTQRYQLGAGVLSIAYPCLAGLRARQVARPFMQELAKQTGGTVSMGVHDGSHMVYVETVRSHDLPAFRPEIGARLPFSVTAMGRAWFAQALQNGDESAFLALARIDPTLKDSMVPVLKQAIESLRVKGYCVSLGDWHPDVHAIAAPLREPIDGDRLVINCGVRESLLRGRSIDSLVGGKLLSTIKKIETACALARHRYAEDDFQGIHARTEQGDAYKRLLSDQQTHSQCAVTLANGIDVLTCFERGETALRNKDFSERTGLSPSTIARLTYTLMQLGYLRQISGKKKYRPGLALLTTAYPFLANMHLRQLARPLMRELAERIGGAVSLVIQDRSQMIYVETSRANESMATHPDIGSSMPMLSTAAGKAWLCQSPPMLQESTLNRLRVLSPCDFEVYFSQLEAARHEFELTGCCSNQGQWRKDVYGFACPLERSVDSMMFVFNCGVPSNSGAFNDRRQEIVPRLRELVQRVDAFLRH